MAPQVDQASRSASIEHNGWSARYAAILGQQLAQVAPDLDVSIESDRIGLTISGAGWAIHAVHGDPAGERYLSLMAMRGMHTGSFEVAIRDLCLAMDASQRHQRGKRVLGE